MKKVISTEKYPIKMWLDTIEEGALTQAKNLGGVLATKDVIIPNSVI